MSEPYRRKGSKFWWIRPFIDGLQCPQSSKETDFFAARDKLRALEGKIAEGQPITPQTGRVRFEHLAADLVTDYENKELASIDDLKRRLKKHINPAIGHLRVDQIKPSVIRDYIKLRKQQGAENGGINRELAAIRRAFRLGYPEKVSFIPKIEMLPEDNERQTSFTEEQFRSVLRHANPTLRSVLIIAYYTGWRIRAILNLEWRDVDLSGGFITTTLSKNRKRVRCPITPFPELKSTLDELRRVTTETEKVRIMRIPWVFHRDGERVRSIRKAWLFARRKAGVPGHVIHDFRRTAVRELNAAGVDPKTIMDICGFKTHAMVFRYIGQSTDERLMDAGKKRQATHG
jgi:integrase